MTAYAGAISPQLATLMQNCTGRAGTEVLSVGLDAEHKGVSSQLFYMLVLSCEDSARRKLEHAGHGEGLRGWTRLVMESEPSGASRHASLMHTARKHGGDEHIPFGAARERSSSSQHPVTPQPTTLPPYHHPPRSRHTHHPSPHHAHTLQPTHAAGADVEVYGGGGRGWVLG